MTLFWRLTRLVGALLAALLLFHLLHHQLVVDLPAGVATEAIPALEAAQADIKQLVQLDPARRTELHTRFDGLQALANRLRILEHNRQALADRQRHLVLSVAVLAFVAFGLAIAWGARRDEQRLVQVRRALAALAAGDRGLRVEVRGGDAIGQVARMIERTSEVVARDRQRLAGLMHLGAWQEATRRQAHELRTPLTVARLQLGRLEEQLKATAGEEVGRALAEVRMELLRLEQLVQALATFARLPAPDPRRQDLAEFLHDFATTFAMAWPGLALEVVAPRPGCAASFDRGMIRQVLVNLCDNSARALGGRRGRVALSLCPTDSPAWLGIEVADDGPGISPQVRDRLFEPYVTTSAPGQGMGLGLAISRKILLDHGGDLELRTTPVGAVFRLLLPLEAPCPA